MCVNPYAGKLDPAHATPNGPGEVTLPTSYAGAHVDHAYARTVDTAQGATVDHSLFAPSESTSAERAYVALSRGSHSNRVYAATGGAWEDAIGIPRTHTFATDQRPDLTARSTAPNVERSASVELDLNDLPNDLDARRAALHDLARRHTTARRGATAGRSRRPWLRDHTEAECGQDLKQDGQHEPIAGDGREHRVGVGM